MKVVCYECFGDMVEVRQDYYRCPRCGFAAEQINADISGGAHEVRQLKHEECLSLLDSIRKSPEGDWTHELTELATGPARYVDRVKLPNDLEVVYFRSINGAGAWPALNWDRFAVQRVPQKVEQMTLF